MLAATRLAREPQITKVTRQDISQVVQLRMIATRILPPGHFGYQSIHTRIEFAGIHHDQHLPAACGRTNEATVASGKPNRNHTVLACGSINHRPSQKKPCVPIGPQGLVIFFSLPYGPARHSVHPVTWFAVNGLTAHDIIA